MPDKTGNIEKQKTVKKKRRPFRVLSKVLFRLILFFVGLSFLILISIKIPFVQNWLVDKITGIVSSELNTKVEIGYVDFSPFNKLLLKGVYIEDRNQDTLLYCDQLNTHFVLSFDEEKRFEISKLVIIDGIFKMKRDSATGNFNTDFIIDYFKKDKKDKSKKSKFDLNAKKLTLIKLAFSKEDELSGKNLYAFLEEGMVNFEVFDLKNKNIKISSLRLEKPELRSFVSEPLLAEVQPPEDISEQDSTQSFTVLIDDIKIEKGNLTLYNNRDSTNRISHYGNVNFKDLDVVNIDVSIQDFSFSDKTFSGELEKIAFFEKSGFEVEKISASKITVNSTNVFCENINIKTPQSDINSNLKFQFRGYPSFNDFVNNIYIKAKLEKANIAIKDILFFAKDLNKNPFFQNNKDEVVKIDGILKGKINSLKGEDLNIALVDGTVLSGNFRSRNITVKDRQSMSLKLKKLKTSMRTLRQIIPKFNPPANFDKLGNLEFSGSFEGFFVDFVAYGKLHTDMGNAEMDMRMDVAEGRENSAYSGNLKLNDFSLGKWMDNPNVGDISFVAHVYDGSGLTLNTIQAKLDADIISFFFKDYDYENLKISGEVNKDLFKGNLKIKDDNVDLSFDGVIDMAKEVPSMDFNADIKKLDLSALRLSKEKYVVSTDLKMEIEGIDISKFTGAINATDLHLVKDNKETYDLKTVAITSKKANTNQRRFQISSEIVDAQVEGIFDLKQLHKVFLAYIDKGFPKFAKKLKIEKDIEADTSLFTFFVNITDSKNLNELIIPDFKLLKNVNIWGKFDGYRDTLLVHGDLEDFQFKNQKLENITFDVYGKKDSINLSLSLEKPTDDILYPHMGILYGKITRDTFLFDFSLVTSNLYDFSFNIKGRLFPHKDMFGITLDKNQLVLFDYLWDLHDKNSLLFGKGFFAARNFHLTSGEKDITINSYGNLGLRAEIKNFRFNLIDKFWDYEKLDFDGPFDMTLKVTDIFKQTGISAEIASDNLFINSTSYGELHSAIRAKNLQDNVIANFNLGDDESSLKASAEYIFPKKAVSLSKKNKAKQSNYLNINADLKNFPLSFVTNFTNDAISDIMGGADGSIVLSGPPKKLDVSGKLNVPYATFTLAFLKVPYFIKNQSIVMNNDLLFDATGAVIQDADGNTATLTGGITHDRLKNLGLDLRIETDRFLGFDLKKNDNQFFYGKAIGEAVVDFSGSFSQANMDISAKTKEGTNIFIPIGGQKETSEVSFITFVNASENTEQNTVASKKLEGLELNINLNIDRTAKMSLIFDEQAGDILQGEGFGDISMNLKRTGDFFMNGEYTITEGDYLFTTMYVVNKAFKVKNGGTITWNGDPFDAIIDIEANYNIKAELRNFLINYPLTEEIREEVKKQTDVELTMFLKEKLMAPTISFDLAFPNLPHELETFVNSELLTLKQNQNELNRQVLGLLVLGEFIPQKFEIVQQGKDGLISTISEFISNQMSIYLSGLFSELFADSDFISGLDFNLAYHKADYTTIENPTDELSLNLSQYFFNDRLKIQFGGNLESKSGILRSSEFYFQEFTMEYFITEDKRIRLRGYYKFDPLITVSNMYRTGGGISFQREFNSLRELFGLEEE